MGAGLGPGSAKLLLNIGLGLVFAKLVFGADLSRGLGLGFAKLVFEARLGLGLGKLVLDAGLGLVFAKLLEVELGPVYAKSRL